MIASAGAEKAFIKLKSGVGGKTFSKSRIGENCLNQIKFDCEKSIANIKLNEVLEIFL